MLGVIKEKQLIDIGANVCILAKDVGSFIRNEAYKVNSESIETKYLNNLVSYVDKEAERQIVEGLKKLLPEAGFIVEEGTVPKSESSFQWIVDPLDGTTNFLYNIPSFAVSIALTQNNETVLGVVYEINRSECFYADKIQGASLNGEKINVSKVPELQNALISTGFPYFDFTFIDEYTVLLKDLMQNTRGIRRLGAAAVDLCYVACGRYDVFFEHSLSPWDVAAAAFIVQQAGGEISDFKGGGDYVFGKQIIASNKELKNIFTEKLQAYFSDNI